MTLRLTMPPQGRQGLSSFTQEVIDDPQVPFLGGPKIGKAALLGLVTGRHHVGTGVKAIAVLADRCTKVQAKPETGQLDLHLPVPGHELLGFRQDDGRAGRPEEGEELVGVYVRSGYSRSMSA